jgi:regulator of sirC expression with transglutaminase-like and TPR domain
MPKTTGSEFFQTAPLIAIAFCILSSPTTGFGDEAIPATAQSPAATPVAQAEAPAAQPAPEVLSNEALAARAKASLVFIRSSDRTGAEHGLGAGFIIDKDGLIATARHVIGDGRDFAVELMGGKIVPVTEVYASTNRLDLVVFRVDAKELAALPLSDDIETAQGREVVAMGHPKGMRNSMAGGIVSGHQDIEDVRMLQLAMPIQPGNSGGPVLDRTGNVVGIVTLKSSVADNVGFAVPVKLLRDMLSNPNPIPMARWRTMGALDSRQWTPLFGANWRQRAGRITVTDSGNGFGGRTLCLRNTDVPELPFDLQVMVKLGDEEGAAGLVFHSDGNERHYGFYPSAGNLRLTRFDGPDVNSWNILHNEPHPAYKPGEWNTLTVRMHAERFECFVNGQKVLESSDKGLTSGKAGLASFRGTAAEFRRFAVGASLLPLELSQPDLEKIATTTKQITPDRPADDRMVAELLPIGESASDALNKEALRMEQQAKQLRTLARDLHDTAARRLMAEALRIPFDTEQPLSGTPSVSTPAADVPAAGSEAAEPDLLRAALLLAHIDNPDVDVNAYVARMDEMAEELKRTLPENATEQQRLVALDKYLFEQLGMRGSQSEYYTRSNSYLNEVIDDREGLPITISVVYMELAKRVGLKVVGVGLPGHFVVRFEPTDSSQASEVIDAFDHGRRMNDDEVRKVLAAANFPDLPRFREAKTPVQIMERMTLNLLNLAEDEKNDDDVLRYLETLVMLVPMTPEHRAKRLEMRARTGRLEMAIRDAGWFVDNPTPGVDVERVREFRNSLELQLERRNAGGGSGNQP